MGGKGAVMFCYDGSDGARHALDRGGEYFRAHTALVVCVWRSLVDLQALEMPYIEIPPLEDPEFDRAGEEHARSVAAGGCERLQQAGISAEPLAVQAVGSVWRAILETADERNASVLVLGSRGLSGVRALMLGSVSHAVVNHSRRPVLIVPPGPE